MLKINLLLLMLTTCAAFAIAQDTLKKTTPAKPAAQKAATNNTGSGIPINPKTGRPYTRYGYGAYANTYKAQLKADSIKKAQGGSTAAQVNTAKPAATKADTTITAQAPKVDKSLNGQYQYLLTKVYNYQKPFTDAFWKNVNDSLKTVRTQLKASNDKIAEQAKAITDLQNEVSSKEQLLQDTDTISFLGIHLAKNTYNLIMWGLVVVIGLIAGIVIARSGGALKEASYRTGLYNELEEEFKAYKAKANEKEKKLARELQTERNKVDELLGRG